MSIANYAILSTTLPISSLEVLPIVDRRLRKAWQEVGLAEQLLDSPQALPKLSFGNWVGGDRDGHPFVTAEVTENTLRTLRANALMLIKKDLIGLAMRLSFSEKTQEFPLTFLQKIQDIAHSMGEVGKQTLQKNQAEPTRQFINLMIERLPLNQYEEIDEKNYSYVQAHELLADVQALYDTLEAMQAHRIAKAEVEPILRKIQIFGFHLAKLDIRQNSKFHEIALAQLITAAGLDGEAFLAWNEQERATFLTKELASPRPFTRSEVALGAEAQAVLQCYKVVRNHIRKYGQDAIGAFIVSMTRSVSDLLTVYVLAREVGLLTHTPEGLVCNLPVVPLFETIEDLAQSPLILEGFLQNAVTKRSIARQARVQQVMIGYSDSNKDGGIFASLWKLNRCQQVLIAVGKQHEVRIRFFHGRGGTVSRGAGPTHRFLHAQPHASIQGDLRFTEQGETIAQKYANVMTNAYNLELLLAGTMQATIEHQFSPAQPHPLDSVLDTMADVSYDAYQKLLHNDGFLQFFAEATPIDVIEASRIGSRPARRTGKRTLEDLRAIPWVFGWGQARFSLSAWYGVGTALAYMEQEHPELFEQVRNKTIAYPIFQYILTNVSSSILVANLDIMEKYASLVTDIGIKTRFMDMIRDEFMLTQRMVEKIYGQTLAERRPNISKMLALRQPQLTILHEEQIKRIAEWRMLKAQNDERSEKLLFELLLLVNAIAGGLRTTG